VSPTAPFPQYVVVSPVKDEERFIQLTLHSMVSQSVAPLRWVIVDDGSKDRTAEVVRGYALRYPYIQLVAHVRAGQRHPGSRVIHAFNVGYAAVQSLDFEVVVKLDCDLTFGEHYFRELLGRFRTDPQLGIASGIYLEADGDARWHPVAMPSYPAFGACKAVRRRCFEDIKGFLTVPGWDTVDEIRAWTAGWRTRHFVDLEARHHRREGSGIGRLRTSLMHGEIFYRTGGDLLFLLFKIVHRLRARPFLLNAMALTAGYLRARLTRRPMLVSAGEARCYRHLLRRRLLARLRGPRPFVPLASKP
jgi:biofilm PGA synthesis N-glycosyltransferase PgaC